MRGVACLVLATLAVQGCRSCRDEPVAPPPRVEAVQAEPEPAPEPDPFEGLEPAAPGSLGLENPDPSPETESAAAIISIKGLLVSGKDEEARQKLAQVLEERPGSLEPSYTMADLMLRQDEVDEAVGLIEHVLLARYPLYAARMLETPSIAKLEQGDAEAWKRLVEAREAARRGWAGAMSGSGAFLLVAPPYPEGQPGDPDEEKLNRGWVVFVDVEAGRYLPLTPRANVAGFILDRAERRLVALSWKSYVRETRDEEGEILRPALMQGVRIVVVDLETFETSPPVDLGGDMVEARVSVRSGHVLATVVELDHETNEGKETSLEIDCEAFEARPAAKAGPGPMDLIVSYGTIEPPAPPTGGFSEHAESIPGDWRCLEPGDGLTLCATPSDAGSVLSDLILEKPEEEEPEPLTLAKGVGILQIDVL